MRKKALLMALMLTISLTGCSFGKDTKIETSTQTDGVESIGTISIREEESEYEADPDTEYAEYSYAVGHTLYDNSITFTDSVAVITYDMLISYYPEESRFIVTKDCDLSDMEYAYVYYSRSPSEYLFQRVVSAKKDDEGNTIVTLSGVPLMDELSNKDFIALIQQFNAYGEITGGEESGFENKTDENEFDP